MSSMIIVYSYLRVLKSKIILFKTEIALIKTWTHMTNSAGTNWQKNIKSTKISKHEN